MLNLAFDRKMLKTLQGKDREFSERSSQIVLWLEIPFNPCDSAPHKFPIPLTIWSTSCLTKMIIYL
ncbi:hypothetical protein VCSRO99_1876 [Vibrio cholerae]|nr:hypothetical protein VCSRO99_1876 [Vibrio cholerae]